MVAAFLLPHPPAARAMVEGALRRVAALAAAEVAQTEALLGFAKVSQNTEVPRVVYIGLFSTPLK